MEELRTQSVESSDDRIENERATRPFLGIVVASAVLYLAKDLLLPVTMAAILAVIFSPVANRLDQFTGRFVSAAMIVFAAVAGIAAIRYFLTIELTSVATQISDYSTVISAKLAAIERSTPTWLQEIETGVADIQRQLEDTQLKPKRQTSATPPKTQSASPTINDIVTN